MTEESSSFNMLSALIGAVIGSIVTLLFRWIIYQIDLCRKKKLMNEDLIHQQEVLIVYRKVTEELLIDFENKQNLERRSHPSFEDLYTDIYEAVPKTELFIIYQKKLPLIVQIYKSIEFLKQYKPSSIYGEYVSSWDEHRKSKEHKDYLCKRPTVNYCDAQSGYFNHAIGQLKLNLNTLNELKRDINSALKIKFYWPNPF